MKPTTTITTAKKNNEHDTQKKRKLSLFRWFNSLGAHHFIDGK